MIHDATSQRCSRAARAPARLSQQQASSTPAAAAAARPFSPRPRRTTRLGGRQRRRRPAQGEKARRLRRVIGNVRGFVDYERNPEPYRAPVAASRTGRRSIVRATTPSSASCKLRCMDCGTPFVRPHGLPGEQPHSGIQRSGLPGPVAQRLDRLHQTNNFPEFTGRVCPAPCERVRGGSHR